MPPGYTTAQKNAISQFMTFTSTDRNTAVRVSWLPYCFFVLSPLAGLPCSSVLLTRAPRVAASSLRSTELPFADLGFDFLASQVTQLESRIGSQWVCDMISICDCAVTLTTTPQYFFLPRPKIFL